MPDDITLDFTNAKVFADLPENVAILFALSAAEIRDSKSNPGSNNAHLEWSAVDGVEDDVKGNKVFEDISLTEEWSLGRLMTRLIAMGEDKDEVKTKSYNLNIEDHIGKQITGWVRIRPAQGANPPKPELRRVAAAAAFRSGVEI